MKIQQLIGACALLLLLVLGCKTQQNKFEFENPKDGVSITFGENVQVKMNFPDTSFDSVVYAVDGQVIQRKQDTSTFEFDTKAYALGSRSLTAKLYSQGKENIAYSNIQILPESAKQYGFKVINEYPHDAGAFTQGLEFRDGFLYETTGQHGSSTLRKVALKTGDVVQKVDLGDEFFGEGMTFVGNKIIALTWRENVGFVYNKDTFEKEKTFNYPTQKEGWGIAYDGEKLISSDGTNRLYFLDPNNFQHLGSVAVYDENGAVDNLNELEYIDGKLYANIYQKDIIVIINPTTGAVEGRVNFVGMYTNSTRKANDNEMNGIAYDAAAKRLFVTGKLWEKLFEVEIIER